jgi:hypothetical protein
MKTLPTILLCLLLACCTAPPPAPTPVPVNPVPVAPVAIGRYVIKEYDAQGRVARTWTVSSFTERDFPRSVTFRADGQTVTLLGSYQIDQFRQ